VEIRQAKDRNGKDLPNKLVMVFIQKSSGCEFSEREYYKRKALNQL
jgi:hypothetical protein